MTTHTLIHRPSRTTPPYALPARLTPQLARVHAYWGGLLRGGAQMPFWDDLKLTDLGDLADRLLLVDVFEHPARFRINEMGSELSAAPIAGRFLDDLRLEPPLEYLASQCSATVECGAPTYFRAAAQPAEVMTAPYGRLLLPMWGDGRIGMLLGAVDFG